MMFLGMISSSVCQNAIAYSRIKIFIGDILAWTLMYTLMQCYTSLVFGNICAALLWTGWIFVGRWGYNVYWDFRVLKYVSS